VQNDIKRVIAYSTCSQLGYMFFAAGVGAYGAAMFHLFTHAFFKALLFLGAGSVIHAMHHEQDMRFYGGLRKSIPLTFWAMLIGTLAITGVGIIQVRPAELRLRRLLLQGRDHRERLMSGTRTAASPSRRHLRGAC
jgi:NADH-quinone oxidoreductase subunit L